MPCVQTSRMGLVCGMYCAKLRHLRVGMYGMCHVSPSDHAPGGPGSLLPRRGNARKNTHICPAIRTWLSINGCMRFAMKLCLVAADFQPQAKQSKANPHQTMQRSLTTTTPPHRPTQGATTPSQTNTPIISMSSMFCPFCGRLEQVRVASGWPCGPNVRAPERGQVHGT